MLKTFQLHFRSISYLQKHELQWLLWYPFIITLLVFYAGFSLTSWATDAITLQFSEAVPSISWLNDLPEVVGTILYWLLWVTLRILLYFVLAFIGGTVILLLMSPVLAYASQRIAQTLGKPSDSLDLLQFARELWRAISLAIRLGVLQITISIICFIIGFIPIIGFVSPLLLFALNAYFYGFGFLDYTLERRELSVAESMRFAWKHRFTTTGLGMPFASWMLIPFIGPMTGGFVALLSTVAATRFVEEP